MAKFPDFLTPVAGWLPDTSLTELTKGSTVWLAVTGLSRAGKTVFITSLIHNLLSTALNPLRMPLLRVVMERRLVAAKLVPGDAGALPRFPYRSNIEDMAQDPPRWPDRTADISEIEVDIRFVPAGLVGEFLGRISDQAATLKVRILDYPGEWLLDLPMLEQSYAEWSRATLGLMRANLRAEASRDFRAFIGQFAPNAPASDEAAKQAHDLYRAYLTAARDQHGLTFLQPGRFLCPGALANASFLRFAPLDIPDGAAVFTPGSLAALMQERFDTYKREAIQRFYEDYFRKYGRQIVLVDVLRALLAGREAFEDTQRALQAILESFRYGRSGILARLLGQAAIDKVLFAATKADHIPQVQWDHLAELLRNMAAFPALDARSGSAAIDFQAIASVASTAEDVQVIDGQQVQVVVGKPVGSETRKRFFVGSVPIQPPRPDVWRAPFLNIPVFEPPVIDASPVEGIPHVNLDAALEFLLGDRLR